MTRRDRVDFTSPSDGSWSTVASSTGRIFAFGDAPSYGDARASGVTDVIGIAPTAPPLPPDLIRFATSSGAQVFAHATGAAIGAASGSMLKVLGSRAG